MGLRKFKGKLPFDFLLKGVGNSKPWRSYCAGARAYENTFERIRWSFYKGIFRFLRDSREPSLQSKNKNGEMRLLFDVV